MALSVDTSRSCAHTQESVHSFQCQSYNYFERTQVPLEGRIYNATSCILNMVLSVLGVGGLTLPYTFATVGWLQGLVMMVLFFFLSMYSVVLLDSTARESPEGTNTASLASVASVALGPQISIVLETLMFLFSFGILVAYIGVVGTQLSFIANYFFRVAPGSLLFDLLSKVSFVMVIGLGLVLPISLLPEALIMRYSGIVGTVCMLFVMVVIVASAPWVGSWPPLDTCSGGFDEPIMWRSTSTGFLRVAPMLIFALNNSTAFLPIRAQLYKARATGVVGRRKVVVFAWVSQMICLVNYLVTAVVGYFTFCSHVPDNVLDGYGPGEILPLAARMALSIQLTASCLGVIVPLLRTAAWTLCCGSDVEMSPEARMAITPVVIAPPVLASVWLKGALSLPLGLTSSICITSYMFIVPGLTAYRLRQPGTPWDRGKPLAFAGFGVAIAVLSTAMIILQGA
mmetsp:Transcript_84287/g.239074  ORF Transcript_84287/g.239074 Transcript_84287/m.239074 type:complete len:455 (-) Transcript_84287:101-1465(-)